MIFNPLYLPWRAQKGHAVLKDMNDQMSTLVDFYSELNNVHGLQVFINIVYNVYKTRIVRSPITIAYFKIQGVQLIGGQPASP